MAIDAKVKSLQKALTILECFTAVQPELGVSEISEKLGLYKSNVHNVITTFESMGYIEQNPATSKYRLGSKILEIAHVVNSHMGLHQVVHPVMSKLADEVREVVYFGIPKDGEVLYLDAAYPVETHSTRSMMGDKAEMYCTALGKAMLAFMPADRVVAAVQKQSMKLFTPNTITQHAQLFAELELVRNRGYAIDNMEHEYGIKCVGVPVFNRLSNLVGAMSITGPSLRFEDETIKQYAAKLTKYSQTISMYL